MPLIRWSRHLELGVYVFDTEHRQLLGLVNDLYEAVIAGINEAALLSIINGMSVFIERHSAHEEEFFHACDYRNASDHIAEHRKLAADIERFRHADASPPDTAFELNAFLIHWFSDHILGLDRDFCEHLRKIGIR